MSVQPEDTFALLEKHHAGDPEALGIILRRCYPRVERIVQVRMRSRSQARADTADLVQDVMVRAIRNLENFSRQEDARLINWLACMAEREILSHVRNQRAAKRDEDREIARVKTSESTFTGSQVDPIRSPDSIVSKKEDSEILDACLATLESEQRECILLRDFAGASWELVAEELDRPSPEAARKFYQRARTALKERLRNSEHDEA